MFNDNSAMYIFNLLLRPGEGGQSYIEMEGLLRYATGTLLYRYVSID